MKSYTNADEPQRIIETLCVPEWHGHLRDASICCLFDEEDMKSKGRLVLAKVRRATPVENFLTGHDLVIIVSGPAWSRATDKQRSALIDHELCHVTAEERDDGSIAYRLCGHDLEEFNAVVKRHGAWKADIDAFVESAQGVLNLG